MKKIIASIVLGLILIACSSDTSNRTVKEFFSAFLNENNTIIAFGSAELNTILDKTDYKNQPKVGAFLQSPVEMFRNSLNLDTPVFYAVEGPIVNDNPTAVYVFAEVKNADTLRANLTKNGFDLEKKGDMDFLQDGDMSIGIENKLAVIIIKNGEYDGAKLLAATFEKSKGDVAEGKVEEILAKKGDIVLGMSFASLYATSNTDLSSLSKDKQAELKAMLKDSYIENLVKFENGEVIFETKNHFSKELTAKLFLRSTSSAPIVAKLGQGTPRFGFSMNLDMKKLQQFMEEYSPEVMEDLSENLGGPFALAMLASGNDLSQIFNGQLGIVMVGEPGASDAMVPDFNFYLGLGPKGQSVGEFAKSMLGGEFAQMNVTKDGISGFTSAEYLPSSSAKLNLPSGCENFGKKSISGFIYLEGMDMSSFDLEGEAKLIELIKYATFEYDNDGGRLVLKAKDGKANVLKQSVEKLIKELEGQVSGLTL